MSLKIRRGTEVERTTRTFDSGELVWTASDGGTGANYHQLWVGDGITPGGVNILATSAGTNLQWDATTRTLKVDLTSITTDNIAPGALSTRQYYSQEKAQDDAALLFTSGSHVGITFEYVDTDGKINATVDASAFTDQIGITAVSQDSAPALGGNLTLSNHNITGTGNISITGDIGNTGGITASGTVQGATGKFDTIAATTSQATLTVNAGLNGLFIKGLQSSGNAQGAVLTAYQSRGSLVSPTAVNAGDFLSGIVTLAHNGSDFVFAGNFGLIQDANVSFNSSSTSVPTGFAVTVPNASNQTQTLAFTSDGVLNVPTVMVGDGSASHPSVRFTSDASQDTGFFHPQDGVVCVSLNGTEKIRMDGGGMRVDGFMKVADCNGTLPSPAEAGMIVLDGSTFKGYNGSSWVALN